MAVTSVRKAVGGNNLMITAAIIQARMTSSRLPGKVLADIAGRPMLGRVVERVRLASRLDRIGVATSTDPSDDPIAWYCAALGVDCFRGSLRDVLHRFHQAAAWMQASRIVRITADCPLIDPEIIDQVVDRHRSGSYDYTTNADPPSFPDGLDAEVFSSDALEEACHNASLSSDREHVTSYLRSHPDRFRLGVVTHETDLSAHRWTVDTLDDLAFVRAIYHGMGPFSFRMQDICEMLQRYPSLRAINAGHRRNEGYLHSLETDHSAAAVVFHAVVAHPPESLAA